MLLGWLIGCAQIGPTPDCETRSNLLVCFNWATYDEADLVCSGYDAVLVDTTSDPYDMDPYWLTFTTELGSDAFSGRWWSGIPLPEPEGLCPAQAARRGWDDLDCGCRLPFMCQRLF